MANQNNTPGFSGEAAEALGSAMTIAGQMGHTYIGSEHLLCALAKNSESAAGVLLARQQIRFRDLILQLKDRVGIGQSVELHEKDFSPRLKKLLMNARSYAVSRMISTLVRSIYCSRSSPTVTAPPTPFSPSKALIPSRGFTQTFPREITTAPALTIRPKNTNAPPESPIMYAMNFRC